jgi:hypothetical protein
MVERFVRTTRTIRSLRDPIERYVPRLRGTEWEGVSIRDILRMESGVHRDEDTPVLAVNTQVEQWRDLALDTYTGGAAGKTRHEFLPRCRRWGTSRAAGSATTAATRSHPQDDCCRAIYAGARMYPSTGAGEWVSRPRWLRPCVPSVFCMIELRGTGLTDRARYHHTRFRPTAVAYLAIPDALDVRTHEFLDTH